MTSPPHPHNRAAAAPRPTSAAAAGGRCPAHPFYGPELGEWDPKELLRNLRKRYGPVIPIDLLPDGSFPVKLVAEYDRARDVLHDSGTFSSDPDLWRDRNTVTPGHPVQQHVNKLKHVQHDDGTDHTRMRKALQQALSDLDRHEPAVRAFMQHIADQIIAEFAHDGYADIEAQFSQRFPRQVMMGLLGIDGQWADVIDASVHELIRSGPQAEDAAQRIHSLMRDLVREKMARPGADLSSWLIYYTEPSSTPDRMGEEAFVEELSDQIWFLLNVGLGATAGWISNCVVELMTNAELRAEVRQGKTSWTEVANLVLMSVAPLQNLFNRWAVRDTYLGGTLIEKGEFVGISFAGTAPETSPDGVDKRLLGNKAHLTWGLGKHACPRGAQDLAYQIVVIALERLFLHLIGMELAIPECELRYPPPLVVRSPERLPVQFDPPSVPVTPDSGEPWTNSLLFSTPTAQTSTKREQPSASRGRWRAFASRVFHRRPGSGR
ncbi:cytochrome P450 [Streptomyces nanshensis]|uniref:cytochrome P450 n=1 Tax=Streptomyces nanshensis TaxID=518642 RepID=UPI00149546EB|nr:cytochrome P450 [Streptomyces nanshensis]